MQVIIQPRFVAVVYKTVIIDSHHLQESKIIVCQQCTFVSNIFQKNQTYLMRCVLTAYICVILVQVKVPIFLVYSPGKKEK